MTDNENLTTGALAVAALLGPVLIGVTTGLPVALYVTFAAVLLIAVGVREYRRWAARNAALPVATPQPAAPPPPPPPPAQTTVSSVELPSDTADYRFRFSAAITWQAATREPTHGYLAAVAREAIITRAAAVTRTHSVANRGRIQHLLAAVLGAVEPDPRNQVHAWAGEITLEVDEQDVDHLRRLADIDRDAQLWHRERKHELDVREYLKDDVLSSTSNTLVWWLARDYERIDGAVDRLGPFHRISAVARGDDDPGVAPGTPRNFVVVPGGASSTDDPVNQEVRAARQLIDQLLTDTDARGVLADDLATSADSQGIPGFGDRLRAAYGLHRVDQPPGGGATDADRNDTIG